MQLAPQDYSSKLLTDYGIDVPKQKVVRTMQELIEFSKKLSFPIFMKIDSPEISHKTDQGLVARASDLPEAVREFKRISEKAKKITKSINGMLVQEYVEGVEFIIGVKNDPAFGKVVMFGTGGIYAEIFKDVSFRMCPIESDEALKMIRETKGFRMMHSRGHDIDENGIARILSSVSKLAIKENIEGLDINPLIAGERNVAVDVKIIS